MIHDAPATVPATTIAPPRWQRILDACAWGKASVTSMIGDETKEPTLHVDEEVDTKARNAIEMALRDHRRDLELLDIGGAIDELAFLDRRRDFFLENAVVTCHMAMLEASYDSIIPHDEREMSESEEETWRARGPSSSRTLPPSAVSYDRWLFIEHAVEWEVAQVVSIDGDEDHGDMLVVRIEVEVVRRNALFADIDAHRREVRRHFRQEGQTDWPAFFARRERLFRACFAVKTIALGYELPLRDTMVAKARELGIVLASLDAGPPRT